MVQDELVAILAVVVVVVVIVAALMLGLWLGFGREISYEEAMASKIAQGEGKEKVVPAMKPKKRKPVSKKKSDSESAHEEEKSVLLPKPILKAAVEKTEASKVVEFDVQTPPPKKTVRPPLSPPTPHPAAMDPVQYAALLSGTEDDELALTSGNEAERESSTAAVRVSDSVPLKDSTAASATLPTSNKDATTPAAAKRTKTKRRTPPDYSTFYLLCLLCG